MRTHEPCVPTAWNIEYTVNVRISQAGGFFYFLKLEGSLPKAKRMEIRVPAWIKKGTPAESFDSASVRRMAVTYSPTFAVPSAL